MLRSLLVSSILCTTTLACGTPAFPESAQHPLLGRPLPEIGQRTTAFGMVFDPTDLRGHPVFFKFYAEYCVPCKKSLPTFQRLHQTHPGVRFVGIDKDDRTDAAELALEYRLTFPVIPDEENVLTDRFQVSILPTSFAVDASGVVRWVGASQQSDRDLTNAVRALDRSRRDERPRGTATGRAPEPPEPVKDG